MRKVFMIAIALIILVLTFLAFYNEPEESPSPPWQNPEQAPAINGPTAPPPGAA